MNKELAKATHEHVAKLARIYGVSNIAMLNAILLGHFHKELAEVMK